MLKHISNIRDVFGLPLVVSINKFPTDTQDEIDVVLEACQEIDVPSTLSDIWAKGGEGGLEMADAVKKLANQENDFKFVYEAEDSIEEKLHKLVTKIYGGDGVEYSAEAKRELKVLTENGYSHLPICVAKTQYSFSDNKNLLGNPEGFTITVKNLKVSAGAGFIVALTGAIMTMPGLPKIPAAENIDVDESGEITGLF